MIISTLTYMAWHVEKYKITFKLVISHWTNEMRFSTHSRILFSSEYFHYKTFINEKCSENKNDNFQENLSRPARYNWCQGPVPGRGPAVEKHWYMSYRIRMELRSILILLASCQQTYITYTIAVCTVKTPDDGQRNCPKHVEFHSKNKFEKSVRSILILLASCQQTCMTYAYIIAVCAVKNSWWWTEELSETCRISF